MVAERGFVGCVDGLEDVFDFVKMEEGDLFAGELWQFYDAGVEGFDALFGEELEKTAQSYEMVGLGDGFEFAAAVCGETC